MTNVFVKHWRLVGLILGIILFIWVLYAFRTFVLPFAIGLIFAYLLMPMVWWLERKLPPRNKWPNFRRIISVLIAFLLLLVLVGSFAYLVVAAVIDTAEAFIKRTPEFIEQSVLRIQDWFAGLIEDLPVEVQEDVTNELLNAGVSFGNTIRDTLLGAVTSIPNTFSIVLGFAVLPFFLFYILKDSEKLKNGLTSAMSPTIAMHGRNIMDILEKVIGRYIRAQLMLALIVAYFSFIGLLLLDIPREYALALALLAGVCEMIPTLGPWIAGAVALIVALATAPEKAIWVLVLYLGIQLLENNLLVPKIQSAYLRIHPAIMIVLLVFGAYTAGLWGIILIGPLAAVLVEIFKYIREHYRAQKILESTEASGPGL